MTRRLTRSSTHLRTLTRFAVPPQHAGLSAVLLFAAGWALAGCGGEDPTFGQVEKLEVVVADFEDFELPGQARLEYQAEVRSDMVHPEFNVRWTNTTRDVVVDLYMVRIEEYDPDVPPNQLSGVFWTSASTGGQFGTPQAHTTVHPTPGTWVIFFFNPADAGRRSLFADLSADVRLTHFASK